MKLLFDNGGSDDVSDQFIRLANWRQAAELLQSAGRVPKGPRHERNADDNMSCATIGSGALVSLLERAGMTGSYSLTPLAGGANNRVYRIDAGLRQTLVLKSYFRHPGDPRDRSAEWAFATAAWQRSAVHSRAYGLPIPNTDCRCSSSSPAGSSCRTKSPAIESTRP